MVPSRDSELVAVADAQNRRRRWYRRHTGSVPLLGHQIIHTVRRVTTTRVGTDAEDDADHPPAWCHTAVVVVAGTRICPPTTVRSHTAIRTAIERLCPGQSAGSPRDTNTSRRGFLLQSHSDPLHSIVIRPWITPLRYLRPGLEDADADGADGDGLDAGDVGDGEDLEEEDGRPSRLVLRSCHRHRHPSREDFGLETCKEIGYRSMNCVSTWPLSRVPYVPIWMFWLTNTRHRGNYATVSAAYLSLRLYSSLFRPGCRLVLLYRNDFDGRELSTRRTGSSCRHWSCRRDGLLLGGFAYGSFQNYVFWRKIL